MLNLYRNIYTSSRNMSGTTSPNLALQPQKSWVKRHAGKIAGGLFFVCLIIIISIVASSPTPKTAEEKVVNATPAKNVVNATPAKNVVNATPAKNVVNATPVKKYAGDAEKKESGFDNNVRYGMHMFGGVGSGYPGSFVELPGTINLNTHDVSGASDASKVAARYERVRNECYPKCKNDPNCSSIGWRVDSRSRGSNCWLYGNPFQPVGISTPSGLNAKNMGGTWARRSTWDKSRVQGTVQPI